MEKCFVKKESTVPTLPDSGESTPSEDVSSSRGSAENSISNSGSTVKPSERGECCYVDEDGNLSDQALHDQIMEGVDERVGMEYARELVGDTMSEADKDYFFPLK